MTEEKKEMEKLFEILKEFDINNIGVLIVVSIILISVATGYIQLFHASRIEAVLMNKNEEAKRFSFMYFILFFVFGVINYLFTINVSFVVVNSAFLMLTFLISFVLRFLKSRGKAIELYWWCEERKDFIIILTSTAIISFAISTVFNINLMSCAILGALAEVLIVAITILNVGDIRSTFVLNFENEKWYVFKRMNDDYLLCGNESNINDATKIRLLAIDYIVEQKLCFEKDVKISD